MEAGHEGDKLKQVRAEWMEKKGKPMLRRLTEIFARGSKEGPFLHGAVPSVADFTLLSMMGFFTCGMVDHVPADFGVFNAPRLAAVADPVKAYPPWRPTWRSTPKCDDDTSRCPASEKHAGARSYPW
jgi:glutathione S-transferase